MPQGHCLTRPFFKYTRYFVLKYKKLLTKSRKVKNFVVIINSLSCIKENNIFIVLTIWFLGEIDSSDLKFGCKVNKILVKTRVFLLIFLSKFY
jgi:hypothetical protein